MIHGIDVAHAILAIHCNFSKAPGQRWILTDGHVYDWWDLALAWGSSNPPMLKKPIEEIGAEEDSGGGTLQMQSSNKVGAQVDDRNGCSGSTL